MKIRLLFLAAALTVAAWPPPASSAETCPFFPCDAFESECVSLGGTFSKIFVAACDGYGGGYSVYEGLCQIPPAQFWDETCRDN